MCQSVRSCSQILLVTCCPESSLTSRTDLAEVGVTAMPPWMSTKLCWNVRCVSHKPGINVRQDDSQLAVFVLQSEFEETSIHVKCLIVNDIIIQSKQVLKCSVPSDFSGELRHDSTTELEQIKWVLFSVASSRGTVQLCVTWALQDETRQTRYVTLQTVNPKTVSQIKCCCSE